MNSQTLSIIPPGSLELLRVVITFSKTVFNLDVSMYRYDKPVSYGK
jgi:hypothetical protein